MLVSIPIRVLLHPATCTWKEKSETRVVLDPTSGHSRRVRVQVEGFLASERKSPAVGYSDAWSVREQFFNLSTKAELLAFLQQVGRFAPQSAGEEWWELETLWTWKRVLRETLTHSPARWKTLKLMGGWEQADLVERALNDATTMPIRFRWQDALYFAVIEARDAVTAMIATIYIDHLRKAKFRFCARHDCGKAFELTSKHKRIYCDFYCAHLESLRRLRKGIRRRNRQVGKR